VFEILSLQQKVTQSASSAVYDIISYLVGTAERMDDVKFEIIDSPIQISEEYLRKMIEEVIDNALKYSDKGTPIHISSKIEDNMYVLSITDFGRGMTEEQINNIDPYVQFERKVYEQQGSGLGISIVRRLLDIHNGDIAVESEIHKYTKVNLKLPIPLPENIT
jgi:signal transduction histidine kinase